MSPGRGRRLAYTILLGIAAIVLLVAALGLGPFEPRSLLVVAAAAGGAALALLVESILARKP